MFNLKAIEVIARSLRDAVENKPEGREGMALGQYLTGMGFSNCGLGIVHSMAHGLGALYDTPHGVANASSFQPSWNTMRHVQEPSLKTLPLPWAWMVLRI